ncbi:hypothetical protein BOX15_Mlig021498g3 [Macrostomum lignano]|uniref:Death domain-containing protein n=1 Tax=Macrostomum lignano TaxID=282301 RepID=A0A267FL00_9PLAT|nr:hypothetical protein BOX15_Mlig021498g3 [Macrostomum lignano]
MPSSNGELVKAFREISHEFKTLQQTRLNGRSDQGMARLSSLDVEDLADRLEQLRSSLAECLTEVEGQLRESQLAAADARNFYKALGEAVGADEEALRRRDDAINSIEDHRELDERAAASEEENKQLANGLRLKSTVADIGDQFQRLENTLKESAINCTKARKRAAAIQEELEEAKRREEERQRQEAEEAERRRQEELRRRQAAEAAAAKAAAAEEAKRRRRAQEAAGEDSDGDDGGGRHRRKSSSSRRRARARAEAEAQRKREAEAAAAAAAAEEAERRWRPVVLAASMADESDDASAAEADNAACAIRAPDGAVQPDDFKCTLVPLDQADVGSIPPGDELVSGVVRLEPAGLSRVQISGGGEGRRHWYFMLPHCAQRQAARETVVYIYEDGRWQERPSAETHIDIQGLPARWVETKISDTSVTAVVVNKLKTDRFSVGKPGIRYSSSVDNRICLTVPEDALKIQLDQTIEVQPVDSSTLAVIKSQLPRETHGLLTCSSIIQHTSICKNTLRPVTFNFQLPLNPAGAKKTRPGTATAGAAGGAASSVAASGRPMTAKPKATPNSDEEDELVVLLGCDGQRRCVGVGGSGGGSWSVLDQLDIEEEPGKDIVGFRTTRFYDRRFIAFRVKPEFNTDTASRICEAIETNLEDKSACFVLRQKSDNLTEVSLALTASGRLDRTLKQLQEAGYDYDGISGGLGGGGGGSNGPGVSEDIRVRERQQFRLRFRGNIICEDDDPDRPSEFVLHFNSQMKNRLELSVTERDRFAQRALDQFRGYIEVTTDMAVQKPVKDAKKGNPHQTVTVMEEAVVAKMLICVPKSEEELRVKSPRATPFVFKSKDSVTMEYLRDLAELVCDNWELLADKLEVSKKRCSVIKKTSESQETQAYDMLITWVKKLPVLKNKVLILCRALNASGYPHLAASLRDAERERRLRDENGDDYD